MGSLIAERRKMNMNREIKFRAWNWNVLNEKWEMFPWERIQCYCMAFFSKPDLFGQSSPNKEPHKIMQFIGLKDKNGVEIYEGDIIPMEHSVEQWNQHRFKAEGIINGFVEWNNIQQRYIIKYPESENHNIISTDFGWSGQSFEVIGNIYENPDLTKVTTTLQMKSK